MLKLIPFVLMCCSYTLASTLSIILPYTSLDLPHAFTTFSPSFTSPSSLTGSLVLATFSQPSCTLTFEDSLIVVVESTPQCGGADVLLATKELHRRGIKLVIVVDDLCFCGNEMVKECQELVAKLGNDPRSERIDRDRPCDGEIQHIKSKSLEEVLIPVVVVDFVSGRRIVNCLNGQKECKGSPTVVASFQYGVPRDVVQVELWTSSDGEYAFKKNFKVPARKLQAKLQFTPRFFIYDAEEWGCLGAVNSTCLDMCLKNKYCAIGMGLKIKGSQVVEENLRQICIYHQSASQLGDTSAAHWFAYADLFTSQCATNNNFSMACSESVQSQISGLNFKRTAECVAQSWKSPRLNFLLENELASRKDMMVMRSPSLSISGTVVHSSKFAITAMNILDFVCKRLINSPPICTCSSLFGDAAFDLLECAESKCDENLEKFCVRDTKCYPVAEYSGRCGGHGCSSDNLVYCQALDTCLSSRETCPICAEGLSSPVYCVASKICVKNHAECALFAPTQPPIFNSSTTFTKGSQVAASEVFAMAFVVVGSFGIFFYVCFWKRQREDLNFEVREIMETYTKLVDEEQQQQGINRRRRRVEVAEDNGGGAGAAASSAAVQ